jgi:hypothetical protein
MLDILNCITTFDRSRNNRIKSLIDNEKYSFINHPKMFDPEMFHESVVNSAETIMRQVYIVSQNKEEINKAK